MGGLADRTSPSKTGLHSVSSPGPPWGPQMVRVSSGLHPSPRMNPRNIIYRLSPWHESLAHRGQVHRGSLCGAAFSVPPDGRSLGRVLPLWGFFQTPRAPSRNVFLWLPFPLPPDPALPGRCGSLSAFLPGFLCGGLTQGQGQATEWDDVSEGQRRARWTLGGRGRAEQRLGRGEVTRDLQPARARGVRSCI